MNVPKIAIILPCYNEEKMLAFSIPAMESLVGKFIEEGIASENSKACFINDGSNDKTWENIKSAAHRNKHICGISLSRNFGHQGALLAGLHALDADAYITIDADLQDNPECIREMLAKYASGTEIVCGVRKRRDTDSFFKRNTAILFYRIMNLCGVKTIPNHADFRLMGRKSVMELRKYKEKNLFLRGLILSLGFKTDSVYYDRKERAAGETKYPLRKMLAFAWNGITSFTTLPLKIISISGILFFITGLFLIADLPAYNLITAKFTTGLFCCFSGINLMALGLIAEYIGKILIEAKQRPSFIIEEKTGL